MRVFISYNHLDQDFVRKLEKILQDKDIDYFLDSKHIEYGQPISDRVKEAFGTATHVVVVISPGSRKSEWVPYEIGFAVGRGLRVLPILTHPAMDLPPFIQDLKYFRSIEEFATHFTRLSANTLQVEAMLELMHCRDLSDDDLSLRGKVGFSKFYKEQSNEIPEGMSPALLIDITNRSGRSIELSEPMVNFRTSQTRIARDHKVKAVGFFSQPNMTLLPGARRRFTLHGPIMEGVVDALINDNSESIVITDRDGFAYQLDVEQIARAAEYAKTFFSDFTWHHKLHENG